jgi:hypothetical protein
MKQAQHLPLLQADQAEHFRQLTCAIFNNFTA